MIKKEHLRKLFKTPVTSPSYAKMETEIKQYNSFLKKLHLKPFDKEVDKLFKEIYIDSPQQNLTTYTAKSRCQEFLHKQLIDLAYKQFVYYTDVLSPQIYERELSFHHSCSGLQITLHEHSYKNSVPILHNTFPDINKIDPFLITLSEKWGEFHQTINSTLSLLFQETKKKSPILKIEEFEHIIKEAIENYNNVKNNHFIPNINTENPYYHFYLFCRYRYLCHFFDLELPTKDVFNDLTFEQVSIKKQGTYSLHDIAKIYHQLKPSVSVKNHYDNLRKNFQHNRSLVKYKKNRIYNFDSISIPLAHYIYYKKKNRNPKDDIYEIHPIILRNDIIEQRIAPLLSLQLQHEKTKINAIENYITFIEKEFRHIISTLSNSYQQTMLLFLTETVNNIFYRSIGLKTKNVYTFYPRD
ncbi:hypothetical protein [Bacillus wiedmannii]|uniref:hypothetical protein n=1 Tax=Bacillus wiedmannii TaxID=1890302 RepID=UPI0021CEB58D|nr:hypothetical protein [Bacillus wiedmannii]MCU5596212.1 hypothetical protein [Bacillus wiedmannii]